jgi:hypothetical protein
MDIAVNIILAVTSLEDDVNCEDSASLSNDNKAME